MRSNIIITAVARLLSILMTVISLPIIIRILGENDYGLYVLIFGFVTVIAGISNLGLGYHAMRNLSSRVPIGEKSSLFLPQFYTHCGLGVLLFVVAQYSEFIPGFSAYVSSGGIWFYVASYFLVYPIHSQWGLLFKFTENHLLFNLVTTLLQVIYLTVLSYFYFRYSKLDLNNLFIAHLVSFVLVSLIFSPAACKIIEFSRTFYSKKSFLYDARHGLPLVLIVVMEAIVNVSDRYVINYYLSIDKVAHYALAATLVSMLLMLPRLLTVVLEPRVYKLVNEGNFSEVGQVVSKASLLFLVIGIPVTIGSYFLGQSLVSLYVSQSMGQSAGPILWILNLGACFFGLAMLQTVILLSYEKTKPLFLINMMIAVINVSLNVMFLKFFMHIGAAAVATLISYMIQYFAILSLVRKFTEVEVWNKELVKIFMAALLAGLVMSLSMELGASDVSLTALCLLILEYIMIYMVSLVILKSSILGIAFPSIKIFRR